MIIVINIIHLILVIEIYRNLDNGSIEAIDSDILSKYQNLTTLSLKNNQLTTIESTTFENLIHLKRL